jgi:3',5'-nucleoside bisphosphate phosphatase
VRGKHRTVETVVPSLHRDPPDTIPTVEESVVIDLHMHTVASDGTCTPEDLVERASRAGIHTISVTDHDTMASVPRATAAAQACGMTVIPGIEITAVDGGKDVHVLAYFLSDDAPGLADMLATQRSNRVQRAREIAVRLAAAGVPIDVDRLVDGAARSGGKSLARPQIARMLIEAGHVASVAEAFDKYLGETCVAYVPHRGASPTDVVRLVTAGGGVASLAHPGSLKKDSLIPSLVEAGLTAIEVFHSSHDAATEAHYLAIAREHGLAVTGGSDYHGEGARRAEFFGVTNLPAEHFEDLMRRVPVGCAANPVLLRS